MRRIGLIDNTSKHAYSVGQEYGYSLAAEFMAATGGNTGNLAFIHAAHKIIENPITRIDWDSEPNHVRANVDHIVICCANQLGSHVDLMEWADAIERFGLPVTLLGLGAETGNSDTIPTLPAGTMKFLQIVNQLKYSITPNVAVRGALTYDYLNKIDIPSSPLGCPSLHISPCHDLGSSILAFQKHKKITKVAVAAGNIWHEPSCFLEPILVDIVNIYQGEYFIQHPLEMIQAATGEFDSIKNEAKSRFLKVYGENLDFETLMEWFRHYSDIYTDPQSWLRSMRRFDLAIGPRYHGVALAIQAGCPGCVITIDNRTIELCLGTGVKSISLDATRNLTASDLVDLSRWTQHDAEVFDYQRRQKAVEYCVFLLSNGIEPSVHLRKNASLP